jgi:hypothetical protein
VDAAVTSNTDLAIGGLGFPPKAVRRLGHQIPSWAQARSSACGAPMSPMEIWPR